ncbi:hypothetical protein BDV26DRAFT_284661 [Aspergillus bertholletiae]|uniref:GPI anchored protein n=1 Tax=Aspergillus bertholletiae TaxID=1226010 RepID=A0A5N7AY28_9EURO|nr:hypothetical protein BDV26DRAFT_284661 [Aspergillus bertholletiae]
MTVKFLMGLAMAGLISANSSVTSLFLPDMDRQSLEASIMGNDATATTYSITCAPRPTVSTSEDDDYDSFSLTVTCSVAGTTSAVCTEVAGGPEANFPGTSVATLQQSEMSFYPVTITAGSITSVAATASATTTAESGSKGTASAAQISSKSSASSSGSSSGSAAVSTGGMPQITGDAGMLFGGAVMALAAAVL